MDSSNSNLKSCSKAIALILSLAVTVIGAILASAFAISITISPKYYNSWGYEYLLALTSPLPGLIVFTVAYRGFQHYGVVRRCLLSIVLGVGVAFSIMAGFGYYSTMPKDLRNRFFIPIWHIHFAREAAIPCARTSLLNTSVGNLDTEQRMPDFPFLKQTPSEPFSVDNVTSRRV